MKNYFKKIFKLFITGLLGFFIIVSYAEQHQTLSNQLALLKKYLLATQYEQLYIPSQYTQEGIIEIKKQLPYAMPFENFLPNAAYPKTALQWYINQATQGDKKAQYDLGVIYLLGLANIPMDEKKSAYWLQKSAAQNYAPAQTLLAKFYYTHRANVGKNLNLTQTIQVIEGLYKQAIQDNSSNAKIDLAELYRSPYFKGEKTATIFSLIRDAAQENNSNAIIILAAYYTTGENVKKDDGKAVDLYRQIISSKTASIQTYSIAVLNLGQAYYHGNGVKKNNRKAFYYYQRAAWLENPPAQFMLSKLYAQGLGTKVNKRKAAFWKARAQKHTILNSIVH